MLMSQSADTSPTNLWRHPDFVKLWAAQTISVFGSLITGTALPFTAVLMLGARPFQMALLNGANLAAGLLVGLIAGVWVDRLRRRPILIATDLARAVLLVSIPLAAFLHLLRMEQLYVVTFLTGILTTFFDVAYVAYLPSLVRREELLEGNSKLSASASIAEAAGFSLAGWLVQWFTGPIAVLIDSLSFLGSAALVRLIRSPEPPPAPPAGRQSVRQEIVDGLRVVWENRLLRALGLSAMLLQFSYGTVGPLVLLYVTRELGFRPGVQGLIYAVGGVSSLVGAAVAGRVAGRLGIGRTLVASMLLAGLGILFFPLARGATALSAALLVAQQLVTDPAATIHEITATTLRQAITADHVLGRVNASLRFAGLLSTLGGTLAAGRLGETIGLRATMVVGVGGVFLAALALALSPVGALRKPPTAPESVC
jgi:MFS family permease